MFGKRGISAVVATVLIILITVAAVTILWTFVIPMVSDSLEFSSLEGRVSVVTSGGYTFYDAEEGVASVQVKRDPDDGVMDRIRIVFSFDDGSSVGSLVLAPESGNLKSYVFDLGEYGEPVFVSVAPIFAVGEKEREGELGADVGIVEGKVSEEIGELEDIVYEIGVDYVVRTCSELFETGNIESGIYEIDPDGEDFGLSSFNVYCDMEERVALWRFDGEEGSESLNLYAVINSDEVYDGENSFLTTGSHTVTSSQGFPVDTSKTYHIEGWFKSGGTVLSKLYFGFVPYDQDGIFITPQSVSPVGLDQRTETTLYEDVESGDKIIKVVNGSGWIKFSYADIAFNIDDSGEFSDVPNYDLSNYNIIRVENMGDYWEVEFNVNVGKSYPAGTKVREHLSGGTYLYSAASYASVPNEWIKYEADLSGELLLGSSKTKWRKNTTYAKVLMLANYQQGSDAKLYYDNIRVTMR